MAEFNSIRTTTDALVTQANLAVSGHHATPLLTGWNMGNDPEVIAAAEQHSAAYRAHLKAKILADLAS